MTDEARSTLVVRVWLPDRPGALGAVASRIGAVGADVHEIEIIDRGGGRAIDEVLVSVPDSCPLDLLAREVAEIDEVDVEDIRPAVRAHADPRLEALAAAARLASADSSADLAQALADGACEEVRADASAVVRPSDGDVLARGGDGAWRVPSSDDGAPVRARGDEWLTAFARGVAAEGAPATTGEADDVAWTVLPRTGWVVVLSRAELPFRPRELAVVQGLAGVADALAVRLGP